MTVTLTYFDFDASRGLECRLALAVAGIDFHDERLQRGDWVQRKPQTPFGALPLLTVDGRSLAQSNAILVWIGRGHGLHPADPWTAAEHEAIMLSVEDLRYKLPGPGLDDDAKKAARQEFAQGWLAGWAQHLQGRIAGPFLEGDQLTVADLKLYTILRAVLGGVYDHIPGDVFEDHPAVTGLYAAVAAHPEVAAYLAGR